MGRRRPTPPLLVIHSEGNQLLAEIPRQSLGADFLVTVGLALSEEDEYSVSGNGILATSGALRWVRSKDSLVLQEYQDTEHGGIHYQRRTAFPILRFGTDSAPVIAAGPLLAMGGRVFMRPLSEAGSPDQERHQTGSSAALPKVTLAAPVKTSPLNVRIVVAPRTGDDGYPRAWTFWRLPTTPMRPRFGDPRISYYDVPARGGTVHYIVRQRLEKRDPNAAVSEVVRPIVYRIDSTVPRRWVPWVKRGIEEWNPVFESIGFRHAIVVRDASSGRGAAGSSADTWEIPVRWVSNASGSANTNLDHVDPRSGEVLYSSINFNAGVIPFLQQSAFIWTGAANPNARYPYADSVLGSILEMIFAHEAGHTLGFDHHFNPLTAYPTDSVRSAAFVHRLGYTPSVMAYAYFNYVAQPEDHISPNELHMRVGPYDAWALSWGYRPIPGAKTPDDELPTLRRWLAAQDTAPYLSGMRFNDDILNAVVVGNDPIKAIDYGIRNLARVAPLIEAQRDPGVAQPESLVTALRGGLIGRWYHELLIIVHDLGSVLPASAESGAAATPAVFSDSARQAEALHFLFGHVFYGRDDLVRQRVLAGGALADTAAVVLFDSVAPGWNAEKWRAAQDTILTQLLDRTGVSHVLAAEKRPARYAPLLPALCTEFRTLDQALARTKPTDPGAEAFRNKLQGSLAKVLRAPLPLCHE